LLTESVLLAMLGGAAGLLFTMVTSRLLVVLVPPSPLPIDASVNLSLRVPLLSFGLALMTTLFFGLAPALQSSRPALVPTLKEARGMVGSGRRWLRGGLVVGQVALSVLLLVGAGLFVRTFQQARLADPGFDLEHGWLASIDLLPAGYDAARGGVLFRQLLQDVQTLPGVESAAIGRDMPLTVGGSGSDTSVEIEGYVPAEAEEITIFYDRISPGFFRTLRVPVLAGRDFTDRDDGDGPPVIVINRTMARRYWPGQDAVGRRVRIGDWATVVGVVDDMAYRGIGTPARPYMYLPLYNYYRPDVTLVVRTAGDPGPVLEPLRAAVRALDASLPLFDERTAAAHRDMAVFVPRLAALMLGVFGGLALFLAGVGLYGLLAFVVTQRTPEIGVRLALGASRPGILRLVVGHGLGLTALGAGLGILLAALLMPLAASQLVGVGAHDLLTYVTAVAVLLGGATLASYLPARRAASVDPIQALRHE
jgi:predicted permease